MREWAVGGGIITSGDSLLMVHNRRRNGKTDWTTPGGVIDPGETMLEGLTREVTEETGLIVTAWHGPVYTVVAEAPDMEWTLTVEAYLSQAHEGELTIDDPDGIVFDARWVTSREFTDLVEGQQRWFVEPLQGYLDERSAAGGHLSDAHQSPASASRAGSVSSADACPQFGYLVRGTSQAGLQIERLS